MRLCWVLTDVIQPWLTILNSDELPSSITEEVPVNVKWEAGGAFKIDTAEIVCLDAQGVNKCSSQEVTNLNVWHGGAKRGQILTEFSVPTSSGVAPGTSLRVKMRMKVDSGWRDPSRHEAFTGDPQSHFVRARSDPTWFAATGNSIIQGTEWWYSDNEVVITVGSRRRLQIGARNVYSQHRSY